METVMGYSESFWKFDDRYVFTMLIAASSIERVFFFIFFSFLIQHTVPLLDRLLDGTLATGSHVGPNSRGNQGLQACYHK